MKKYLLSFLLIMVSTIGNGWSYVGNGTCEYFSSTYDCNDDEDLCLGEHGSNGGELRWTCDNGEEWTCYNTDYVIVRGRHKIGNKSSYSSGIQVYQCRQGSSSQDWWEGYGNGVEMVPRCNDTMDPNKWILGFENVSGSDVYVLRGETQDSYEGASTKAYSFRGEVSRFLCKMETDKKCDKRPINIKANTSAWFCKEDDQVNVYRNFHGRWQQRTGVNVSVCTNSPSGNSWTKVGAYNGLVLFTNKADFIPGVSFGGIFNADGTVVSGVNRPGDYCLWCEELNMTPKEKEGGGYECVEEPEDTGDDSGGDDSGGGDSSPEPPIEEDVCGGVKCNSAMNGKYIFCAQDKENTFVYKCESGHWEEEGVYGYCCNKNCSKPKKTNFVLGGSWTPDSNHEMWFSTTARISAIAWRFNSTDINSNCTACKEGTKYNKTTEKCEQ